MCSRSVLAPFLESSSVIFKHFQAFSAPYSYDNVHTMYIRTYFKYLFYVITLNQTLLRYKQQKWCLVMFYRMVTNRKIWRKKNLEPGWADHFNKRFIWGVSKTDNPKFSTCVGRAVTPSTTHLECRCRSWLDCRSGTGTGSRDGRGGLGRLFDFTARLLLLLLLLGLSTCSLLLGPLPVLLLLLLGDVLEASLDASCAAAGWWVESQRIKKWVHTSL